MLEKMKMAMRGVQIFRVEQRYGLFDAFVKYSNEVTVRTVWRPDMTSIEILESAIEVLEKEIKYYQKEKIK